jgi:hypothetical protein
MYTLILILGGLALAIVGGAAVFSAGAKAALPFPSHAEGDEPQPARRVYLRDLGFGIAFGAIAVSQWIAAVIVNLR